MKEYFENKPKGEELTEAEESRIKAALPDIERIFDEAKTPDERRGRFVAILKPFFDKGIANADEFMPIVEDCVSADDRNVFMDKAVELARMYMIMRRKDVKGIVERLGDYERRGIKDKKIVGYLDYEKTSDGKIIKIHLAPLPDKKPGPRLRIETLKELKIIAKQVKNDSGIEKVELNSWIVNDYPKLIEELGFTLMEKSEWEGRMSQRAEISIENFLKIYGDH